MTAQTIDGLTTFQAVWPILDLDQTLAQLKKEASYRVPELMRQAGVRRDGPGTWEVKPGAEMPGWAAYHLVLVHYCPAVEIFGAGEMRRNGVL
jgi:hypothetical protein